MSRISAIVLAGGLGTRLRAVVPDWPKPMAPVRGEPFLAYLLRYLGRQGVNSVLLSVGYKRDAIQTYFGSRFHDMDIGYCAEEEPLGTGGAIIKALRQLEGDRVFVVNGDTLAHVNYVAMNDLHERSAANITMALSPVPDTSRYGAVEVMDGRVTRFSEKGRSGPGLINVGVYRVSRDFLLGQAFPEKFSFESDFLYPRVAALGPAALVTDGYFIDIGVPEDYQRAQQELPDGEPS